jgi:uncharacterized caspase-like protein
MVVARRLFLATIVSFASVTEAVAEKRVAMVIGNSEYKYTPRLENPRNDATDMAAALKLLGFEVVEGRDLDESGMRRTIKRFAGLLTGADVGLFFYAGHGLQVSGHNYLVPVDARLENAAGLDFELIRLDVVHRAMERETKANVIFLDACRDNPLSRNLARSMGTRSSQIGRGLAVVESGVGTLISFSTQPGNVALDGEGRNSPFAGALIKHISNGRDDLSTLLIQVRNEVMAATRDQQIPWEHSALRSKFYFAAAPPAPEPAKPAEASFERRVEFEYWTSVKGSSDSAVLGTYLERYPKGEFAPIARALIEHYERQLKVQAAARAQAIRLEEERKGREAAVVEVRKGAEETEVAKLSTKVANLPAGIGVVPSPDLKDPTLLARSLQSELKRVGCDPGPADGNWGRKSANALRAFARAAKISISEEIPTEAALAAVTGQKGQVCTTICSPTETAQNGECVSIVRREPSKVKTPARRTQRSDGEKKGSTKMCLSNASGFTYMVPCSEGAQQR